MKSRRNLLRALTLVGGVATLKTWTTPIVNAVVLPAHAQTSVMQLSCLLTDTSLNPIAEGATYNQDVLLTFFTSPPEPGATVNWVGRCNGVNDFAVQSDTLDGNGELLIAINTAALCGGGPPTVGDVILHNGILNINGSEASCSFVFGP